MKTLNDVRRTFLDHFAAAQHAVLPSAPLVPHDPTLMFTAAGMVPFKDYFTGAAVSPNPRVATSQKCVRAGGKHNDLENVGYTARHHTFFEMLGNFSFGDYFKEEAIKLAWELVHGKFGLPRDKLLVTVYHTDDEAAALWKKIAGFSDDKIIRIATSDNFWSAGDTGPCGPCTEIFYDNGPSVFGGPPGSKDEDGDRFKEIWNLVFMQYDQVDGKYVPLPKPSIDTGMGLERMASVLQGKLDNFDIDLFQAIIADIQSRTNTRAVGENAVSQRVIADHLRASAFLVADGVLPSNEGRGYVLRRIMRRAMRHAYLLGAKEPLMHQLFPTLSAQMGADYPELNAAAATIKDVLYREEDKFRETLERGLKLLDDEMGKLPTSGVLPGDVAFKLYDTFGFPLDLTADVLKRKNMTLDTAGFDAAMERQKEMGRDSWKGSGDALGSAAFAELAKSGIAPTQFDRTQTKLDNVRVVAVLDGALVLDKTVFYAESGGQIGDTGTITTAAAAFAVTDTQKIQDYVVHIGHVQSGAFRVGDSASMQIDADRRQHIEANHSATHLLHEALRRVMGDHIAQKGSLVEADRLRLDVSQPDPITRDQLKKITDAVRAQIAAKTPVKTVEKPIDEARAMGARALFGEKYGDVVRVVSMGIMEKERPWSIELCGGTHVKNTGDIGAFRITSESGVSAGVRRVAAVVGDAARALAATEKAILADVTALLDGKADATDPDAVAEILAVLAAHLKVTVVDIPDRLRKINAEIVELSAELKHAGGTPPAMPAANGDFSALVDVRQKHIQALRTAIGALRRKAATGDGAGAVEKVGNVNFLAKIYDDVPAKDLKPIADQFKQEIKSGVIVLATRSEGKASIVTSVTADLSSNPKYNAVTLVNTGAALVGGKGGGRPDMAQAGGTDVTRLDDAVAAIRTSVAS